MKVHYCIGMALIGLGVLACLVIVHGPAIYVATWAVIVNAWCMAWWFSKA